MRKTIVVAITALALVAGSQDAVQRGAVEAVLGRPRAPLLSDPLDGHAVVLAPPRLKRRHLRCARRRLPARDHQLEDLGAALREVLDHAARDTLDVGGPVHDRLPAQPELA